jgi:hypothetical protein
MEMAKFFQNAFERADGISEASCYRFGANVGSCLRSQQRFFRKFRAVTGDPVDKKSLEKVDFRLDFRGVLFVERLKRISDCLAAAGK